MLKKKESTAQVSPPPEMFTDMERVALSGITKKEDLDTLKREIKPGVYSGAVALSLQYKITKSETVDAAPQVNIITPTIVALAIVQLGINDTMQEKIIRAIKNAAIDVLIDETELSAKMSTAVLDVTSQFEAIKDSVAGRMEKTPRSGKTGIALRIFRLNETAGVSVPADPGPMGVSL